jgi:hypothetical protein
VHKSRPSTGGDRVDEVSEGRDGPGCRTTLG